MSKAIVVSKDRLYYTNKRSAHCHTDGCVAVGVPSQRFRLFHILVLLYSFTMTTQESNIHMHNMTPEVGLQSNIIREIRLQSNITNNVAAHDQYNYYISPQVETSAPSSQPSSSLAFNDAPIDLLSAHFTGREKELARVSEILNGDHEDKPIRCVVHGMHGLGKTQLALQFANSSYDNGRYSLIFWISATTIDKLNDGFANILDLIRHPGRPHLVDQRSKLTEVRRWLEDSTSTTWLLVLDNVDVSTLNFIRNNLPRQNRQGNILFTTRTADVASALSYAAGQQHQVLELGLPDVQDAVKLLLTEIGIDATSASWVTKSKASEVVKCVGCLPLAISQAASFMKQCHKELDYMLLLLQSEQKMEVCAEAM
jgi:hypothetical protein